MFCQKCGTQNENAARFCDNCGAALDLGNASNQAGAAPAAAPVTPAAAPVAPAAPMGGGYSAPEAEAKAPDTQKYIKIAIAAVVAIVVVILGFTLVKGLVGGNKINYEKLPIVYVKDGEVMVQRAGKAGNKGAYELGSAKDLCYVTMSQDGKYLFYGDNMESNGEFDLCVRKATDAKGSSEKEIESGVTGFEVAPDGKMVVFSKSGKLYISNLKKAEQIDKNVQYYDIVGDGKYVLYTVRKDDAEKEGSELYLCKMSVNAEPVEIDDEVTNYWYPRNDDTYEEEYKDVLYYEKDEKLFYVKNGKNPVEILDDFGSLEYIDGNVFATTVDEKTLSEDEAFKVTEDEDGYETRELLPGVEYGEYDAEKGETTYLKKEYTIYTIDGKKAKALDGTFNYVALDDQEAVADEETYVIKSDGKLINIGKADDDEKFMGISDDEKIYYTIVDVDEEEGTGKLVANKLTSKGLGKATEIAEDVADIDYGENGVIFVYTKDDDDQILNVYYKNKYYAEIGENASIEMSWGACNKTIYFLDDVQNGEGTLMKYTLGKKEAVKIDDDVRSVAVRGDKMAYYLADWDEDDAEGTLFLLKGNKAKEVDNGVYSIGWSGMSDLYED